MKEKKKRGSNIYSVSVTNAPSYANELSGSLMPGYGVNMAVAQCRAVKHSTAKFDFEDFKKTRPYE